MANGEQADGSKTYNEAGTGNSDRNHGVAAAENQEPAEVDKKEKKKKK